MARIVLCIFLTRLSRLQTFACALSNAGTIQREYAPLGFAKEKKIAENTIKLIAAMPALWPPWSRD